MTKIELWGPSVWNLFHVLIHRLNDDAYSQIAPSMFSFFVRICKFLPCPDCAADANMFLAKCNVINNKPEFKNLFYLFHNRVNAKTRKPLFNYANINQYENYKLIPVVNNFLITYKTKGNMKMLSESFQRSLVTKDFIQWFSQISFAFIKKIPIPIYVSFPIINVVQEEDCTNHSEDDEQQDDDGEEEEQQEQQDDDDQQEQDDEQQDQDDEQQDDEQQEDDQQDQDDEQQDGDGDGEEEEQQDNNTNSSYNSDSGSSDSECGSSNSDSGSSDSDFGVGPEDD